MYVTASEATTLLNINTAQETAILNLLLPLAHSAVKEFLLYDPEQRQHVEFHPRRDTVNLVAGRGGASLDVNSSHTRAVLEFSAATLRTLQLETIPVRSVTELLEDSDARHGTASGAFGSGTEWTEGEDFHPEYDQPNVCWSGQLFAVGSWPSTPGSVKVTYYGGFSPAELAGTATADAVNAGIVTTAGVDASAIKRALLLSLTKAFSTAMNFRKKSQLGFAAGPLKSERLGDYSYQLSDASVSALTGLAVSIPPEAEELLSNFRHYGQMRL